MLQYVLMSLKHRSTVMVIKKVKSNRSKIVVSVLAVILVIVSVFLWNQNKSWIPKRGECLQFEGEVYYVVFNDPKVLTVNLNFKQTIENPYTKDMINIQLKKEELESKGFKKTECIHTDEFFTD